MMSVKATVGMVALGVAGIGGVILSQMHPQLPDDRGTDPLQPDPIGVPSSHPGPPTSDPSSGQVGGTGDDTIDVRSVDSMVDRYMDAYDHDHSGSINISPLQTLGAKDERVTGPSLEKSTMIEFLRTADENGNEQVSRSELRAAIARFDTIGPVGINPKGAPIGDGYLGPKELEKFRAAALTAHGGTGDPGDDLGVSQNATTSDGRVVDNEAFFKSLPAYRARS